MKLHHKLQARLALLVLVAVLPLVAFSIVTSLRDARRALDASHASLELSVSLAASSLAGVSDAARGLLTAVASSNELRGGDRKRCEDYLAHVVERFPHYADVGLVGMDGTIRCSGRARAAIGLKVDDRVYFREALARNDFAIGDYMQGRVSGVQAIGFGLPLRDPEGGQPSGIAYVSLDLAGLAERIADVRLPPGARLSVLDRNGTVLAAQAEEAIDIGQRVRSEVLRQAVQQGQAGVIDGTDPNGQDRIYAFAPAAGEAGTRLMASISLDRAQVVGPSMRALYTEVGLLLLLTAVGTGMAWRVGGRALTQPVRRILDMADRVAGGELAQRVGPLGHATADELVRMGVALDRMADTLQQRQEALRDELQRSHQAQATQALVFNSMHEGLWAADLQGNLLLYNAAAASMFPIAPNMGDPQTWTANYGLLVPDSERPLTLQEQPLYRAMQGESGQADIGVRNDLVPGGCVLRCSYRPLTGAGGELIGGLVVFGDITELRKAEMQEARIYARLRETQRRLVDALRVGRIGNWEQDLRTGENWWSDEVYEMFGLSRAEAREGDAALFARIHPDDFTAFTAHRGTAAQREGAVDIEFRLQMPDGSVRWMLKRGQVYRGAGGEAVKRSGVIQDITQRKKSQAELLLLRNAVERINDIVLIVRVQPGDAGGLGASVARVLYANPAFERLTGHSADAETGQPLTWLEGPRTDVRALARLQAAVAGRHAIRQELLACTRTGAEIWLEFDVVPFGEQQAGAGDLILVGRDITDRKLAETALAESEQRHQALFEHGPMPMWVFEEGSGRLLAVNNAALRQYGYSREEMINLSLMDMRPDRERERMLRRIRDGYPGVAEGWTHRRRDGSEFPVDVMSNPVRYGGTDARFAVIHDISSRVQAEQNLQEHLFTLQRATDATQMVLSHQTLQGTLHEVVEQARAVIRAHQCVISLVHGGDWAHAVHAASLSDKYDAWRASSYEPPEGGIHDVVRETNRPLRLADAALRAHPRWPAEHEGTTHPPMRAWLGVPLINRRGENIGVLQLTDKYEGEFSLQDEYVAMEMAQLASIALENVTLLEEVRALNSGLERKVHERTLELMREQARYRAVTDQAPQIIWSYESGKGVTYFNRNWYELVGGTSDYWLGGNRWMDVIHPEDRDTSLANWVVARQTRTVYKGERRIRDKFGRYHIMSYRGAPVYDDAGRVICWVGIDTDITESKAVEAQLRESNRELEAFSYSVSHDLRSPLNTIHGFSKLLAREVQPGEGSRIPHYLDRIQAATGYMGQLIEDLLSLAQVSRANLRNEAVDLSEVARVILERLAQGDAQRDVQVQVQSGLIGWGDVRLLRVMLENLLANAWKFTSQTASARIEVGVEDEGVFFVRDNGAGFDMTYADKLFGVFHRLHAATEFPGTGIGLATVHRIVTRHQGRVWAEGRPGEGATFRFVLGTAPATQSAAEAAPMNPPKNP